MPAVSGSWRWGLIFCFEVLLAACLRLPPVQTYYGLLTPQHPAFRALDPPRDLSFACRQVSFHDRPSRNAKFQLSIKPIAAFRESLSTSPIPDIQLILGSE